MTTWQTRVVSGAVNVLFGRRSRTYEQGMRQLASPRPETDPPRAFAPRMSSHRVAGFMVDRVMADPAGPHDVGAAVVYLHGGAFIHGIARQHWDLVAELADATRAPVYVPRYGKAPGHTIDDVVPLLAELLDHAGTWATPDEGGLRVHLAGDSAGGNLALLMAQQHRGDPRVRGLSLIAPALDLSLSNPTLDLVDPVDPWLSRAGLRPALAAWAGRHALDSPEVSPLYGDLTGLPPTDLYVGTRDICWPDALVLKELAPPEWDLTIHEAAGSPHVYPLLPTPEGRAARAHLLARAAASLTPTTPTTPTP